MWHAMTCQDAGDRAGGQFDTVGDLITTQTMITTDLEHEVRNERWRSRR